MSTRAEREGSVLVAISLQPKACEPKGFRILAHAEVCLGGLCAPLLIIRGLFGRTCGGVIWTTQVRAEGGVSLPALSAPSCNQSPAEGSP